MNAPLLSQPYERELEERARSYALALEDGDEICDHTDWPYVRPFWPILCWWLRGRGLGVVRTGDSWVVRCSPRWEETGFGEDEAAVIHGRRCYVEQSVGGLWRWAVEDDAGRLWGNVPGKARAKLEAVRWARAAAGRDRL